MVYELANEFDLNNKSLGKTKRLKHDTTTLYNKIPLLLVSFVFLSLSNVELPCKQTYTAPLFGPYQISAIVPFVSFSVCQFHILNLINCKFILNLG